MRPVAAFKVRVHSAEVQLLQPQRMANAGSHSPPWRQPNGDALSDVSTSSAQRRQSQRTAYWTGAAVAQLPGLQALVDSVLDLKAARARLRGDPDASRPLAGRAAALLFPHPCLHTRVAFETGFHLLGGSSVTHLGPGDMAANIGEEPVDTARLLSRVVDCLVARPATHAELVDIAEQSGVPVINGGTDCNAPCQVLGDLATVQDHKRQLAGLRIAIVSAGGPVTASWLRAAKVLRLTVVCICPPGHEPDMTTVNVARAAGTDVSVTSDLTAATDADVIYIDDSGSGCSEQETAAFLHSWLAQADGSVLAAAPEAIVLHSLPVRRGSGATDPLLDSDRCVVGDQAECRMLATQAVLLHCSGLREVWHPLKRNGSNPGVKHVSWDLDGAE